MPRRCILIIAAVLLAAAGVLLIFLSMRDADAKHAQTVEQETQKPLTALYKNISQSALRNAEGAHAVLPNGRCSVLLFWASWCPDCERVLPEVDAAAELVRSWGADFYLVNRLEPEKESVNSAQEALSKLGVAQAALFDDGRMLYDALGLSMIPSIVIADDKGVVTAVYAGGLPEENTLLSMLNEARLGKAAQLSSFIQSGMTGGDGGVRTEYISSDGETPCGDDVLSESQGLFMLCAQDAMLFDLLYGYTRTHIAGGELAAWVTTDAGDSTANAVIDDLRIIRALNGKKDLTKYAASVYEYNVKDGHLVDFFDFQSGGANRLTLCYADFEALDALAKTDSRFEAVRADALEVVKNGYISDELPLYKTWFDYSRNVYPNDTLNMAQEFTTLLHLARVGELSEKTLCWMRDRLEEGRIWAAYSPDGKAAERYESTAVYALAAMTALSAGDAELAAAFIEKMEAFKVRNIALTVNGAFGNTDGTGIRSFDQLTAANAYMAMENTIGHIIP